MDLQTMLKFLVKKKSQLIESIAFSNIHSNQERKVMESESLVGLVMDMPLVHWLKTSQVLK